VVVEVLDEDEDSSIKQTSNEVPPSSQNSQVLKIRRKCKKKGKKVHQKRSKKPIFQKRK